MTFRALAAEEEGQTLSEYALLLSLVTLAAIGGCAAFGVTVLHLYVTVMNVMP